ncbi:DUF4150 domain-containing protein [uncultured Paracoccus sp.]|uniref:DUF4150 domain-containing protein n=1 Tax=uncultured Paracoccus sp. TaxID=189685 RepID=UPI0026018CA2|nr:DUF4150 domain-containing protein [uncultured Paracoccus sp.]
MTVFANGLEISSKKQGCKVIAAFPDTCFTPPLTPATPPGVPVPYPDFGQDSDLTSGTGTVNIGGEPVSQENSSKYSKCSGDEAGSAPKKGIITSKNMGAVYAQKWSMDVKFEGKGVVRFSDMATSNHACNPGDSPPWVKVALQNTAGLDCPSIFAEFKLHAHEDKKCPPGHESEHFVQNEYLQWKRGKVTADQFKNYQLKKAPCICMKSYNDPPKKKAKKAKAEDPKRGSPHNLKTVACNDAIRARTSTPTLDEAIDICTQAVVDNDPRTKGDDDKKELTMKCLKAAFMAYMDAAVKENDPDSSAEEAADQPIAWEVSSDTETMWLRG